jgi:GAF domain-containing protein
MCCAARSSFASIGSRAQSATPSEDAYAPILLGVRSATGDETAAQSVVSRGVMTTGGLMEEFLRRLNSAESVGAAAQAAVDLVRSELGVDISWSGVISGEILTMAAHNGLRTSRMATTWTLALGQGIGGRVAIEGRTLAVRDYRHDPRRVPVMKSLIDEEGIRGALCAPLVDGADVLGVLYAAARRSRDWTPDEHAFVTDVARDTGSAIRRIHNT